MIVPSQESLMEVQGDEYKDILRDSIEAPDASIKREELPIVDTLVL